MGCAWDEYGVRMWVVNVSKGDVSEISFILSVTNCFLAYIPDLC